MRSPSVGEKVTKPDLLDAAFALAGSCHKIKDI